MSYIAIAGMELSLSSWCMHHYIFTISQLWLTSHLRNTVVRSTGHRNSDHSKDRKGRYKVRCVAEEFKAAK